MTKIDELTAQIEKLQIEKQKLLDETRSQELKSILEKIKAFGFTAKELNLDSKSKEKTSKAKTETVTIPNSGHYKNKKYKGPFNSGQVYVWTGKRMKDDFKAEVLRMTKEEFDTKYLVQ